MAKKLVVYSLPGAADVTVRRDLAYQGSDGPLVMDPYEP